MVLGFLPNFQNVTDAKVPNQFSNFKRLLILKTKMVNLSHWKLSTKGPVIRAELQKRWTLLAEFMFIKHMRLFRYL